MKKISTRVVTMMLFVISLSMFNSFNFNASENEVMNITNEETYVDPNFIGEKIELNDSDLDVSKERAEVVDYVTKTKLNFSKRYNYGSTGTTNPKNFGRNKNFDREIRTGIYRSSGKTNVTVDLGYGPVSIAMNKDGGSAGSYKAVPTSLRNKYTCIYNYNDVTVKNYTTKYYSAQTGVYKYSKTYNRSYINGYNLKAKTC